ncbi:FGGY-family carbohydrate kinase [Clostridium cadaveris]|uniref:Sugar (Pentulose or hexulose) kinase n=2 Tax=Clostridium cadaveris TaxID=1529 RepID=A0A1I2K576_9CLOT|nr:FGGY-family carbohydrate kinase [Clostridium cadaveris]MDM8310883.1 FGGY-family carbohydrate kinase [Clostridium cadaveris]SFF62054.1 Sugar (pentulose or hexulose) kinase [Clostridium cadaveris]
MEPLILTFDLGTQSMRGMLVDKSGNIVSMVQHKYVQPYFSRKPGWAEQKPEFYYKTLCEIGKELKEKNENGYDDVIAVTLTTIRDSCICLDKNYNPLTDVILWLDSRETRTIKPFKWWVKIALKIVRMDVALKRQYQVTKANWIIENEPDIWSRTKKFVMLPTYLNYLLTGELKDCPANMIGHIPFDYRNGTWQSKNNLKRCMCDIPEEMMCDLVCTEDVIGYITKESSELSGIPEGLPLISTGSDKGCETLGLSVIHENQAALSFGTTATIQFATRKYFEPEKFLPAYPGVPKGIFNPEIQIYRGYWLISWFKREFAAKECVEADMKDCSAEELLNERLREIEPGCDGLILQPFWTPGVIKPNAKGAVIGFSDVHTRIHLYRAIIEGIGFALMDGMYSMERRSSQKISELYVAGGGSKSDEICQITADMFGLPVKRIQTHEACGLGASIAGFVAMREFKNYEEAMESMVHVKDIFEPKVEVHKQYEAIYKQIYRKIYSHLLPLYKKIKILSKHDDNFKEKKNTNQNIKIIRTEQTVQK